MTDTQKAAPASERLRNIARTYDPVNAITITESGEAQAAVFETLNEAADEIDALRTEVAGLTKERDRLLIERGLLIEAAKWTPESDGVPQQPCYHEIHAKVDREIVLAANAQLAKVLTAVEALIPDWRTESAVDTSTERGKEFFRAQLRCADELEALLKPMKENT